jgi:hypothetical protein
MLGAAVRRIALCARHPNRHRVAQTERSIIVSIKLNRLDRKVCPLRELIGYQPTDKR